MLRRLDLGNGETVPLSRCAVRIGDHLASRLDYRVRGPVLSLVRIGHKWPAYILDTPTGPQLVLGHDAYPPGVPDVNLGDD